MEAMPLNWSAIILGAAAAYGLGMIWFGPLLFGKVWSTGSHNLKPQARPPVLAMFVQLLAIFALAMVVGMTATTHDLATAIMGILSVALMVGGMDLFSQKSGAATVVDVGYVIASGVLMILAQAIL